MRIIHVYKDYSPVVGGIENHVRDLAEGQASRGHDVTVLITAPDGPSVTSLENGVTVVRAARFATVASTPLSTSLVGSLRSARNDVTHLHSPYPLAEAAWLAVGSHPMVLTYHSDVVRQRFLGSMWAPFLRRVLARCDRVLATSPRYVESSPFLREVRDRVSVVPLGIDIAPFSVSRGTASPDERSGGTLVFVGRLRYYKGLDVLIDALGQLPDSRLLVIGTGPMESEWRARAKSGGVDDRISWLGHVPDTDLPHTLASGDVYVLPATARSEAYGVALLEGMATGLPAVTTELGTGTSWLNEDGVTGYVVPPNDPHRLAAAIADLLADGERRAQMGDAARRRVVENFTIDEMINNVEEVYRQVTR